MLCATYGAGNTLCFLPDPVHLMLHSVILSFRPSWCARLSSGQTVSDRGQFYLHSLFPTTTTTTTTSPLSFTTPRDQTEMGKKRASPGADTEKNPLGDPDLNEAQSEKLQKISDESVRVDIALGT